MSNYKIPTSDSFNSPMPRLRPTGLASRNDMKPEEPEQGPLERFFSLFRSSGGESKPPSNKTSSSRAMKFYDASNNRDTKPSGNISSSPMRIGKARAELDLFEELDVVAPGVITVASGDTLSAIARDNNTTVAEIQKANPTITNVNQINVGQDINIPSASKIKAKPSGIMTKPKLRSITKTLTVPNYMKDTSTFRKKLKKVEAKEYNTIFGNAQKTGPFKGTDVTSMSMDEIFEFTKLDGAFHKYNLNTLNKDTTAIGKFQMVGTTLRDLRDRGILSNLNIDSNTIFNEDTQNRIAAHLAERRVIGKTDAEARKGLRNEWQGFNKLNDKTLNLIIKEIRGN
jgi:LysM repeat protein